MSQMPIFSELAVVPQRKLISAQLIVAVLLMLSSAVAICCLILN